MSVSSIPAFNLQSCEPNKAFALSQKLQNPLKEITYNFKASRLALPHSYNTLSVLAKTIYHFAVFVILAVPASISYLIGSLLGRASSIKLNPHGLSLKPTPIDIPDPEKLAHINLDELIQLYETHFPLDRQEQKNLLKTRISEMKLGLSENGKQAGAYVSGIINLFKTRKISAEKLKDILHNLFIAFEACGPTWGEQAKREYDSVLSRFFPDYVFRKVQLYKENLLLDIGQVDIGYRHWHFLNDFRRTFGSELGFDQGLYDQYSRDESSPMLRSLFLNKYQNISSLIQGVCASINAAEFSRQDNQSENCQVIFEYLKTIAARQGAEDPGKYVQDNFFAFDDNYRPTLNFAGTVCLLKAAGVLQ